MKQRGMEFADPRPLAYDVAMLRPVEGRIELEVTLPDGVAPSATPGSNAIL